MIKKTLNLLSRLLLIASVCMMASSAHAESYFYMNVPTLTPQDMGSVITLPVKAIFDRPVTTWEVQFEFPDGLTPISCSRGNDLTFSASDWEIDYDLDFYLTYNENFTRFACSTCGYRAGHYDEYLQEFIPLDLLSWTYGKTYDEMFFITMRVEDYFAGGDIHITNKTISREGSTLVPVQVGSNGFIIESDVNRDGTVTIDDLTNLLTIIVEGNTGYWYDPNDEWMQYQSGDINHDCYVDLTDVEQLCDYLWLGEWYNGYHINEASTSVYMNVNDIINENIPPTIDFYIADTLTLTDEDFYRDITLPIKASFDGYISSWEVQIDLPDGIYPIRITPGSDMTLNYFDNQGESVSNRADYTVSSDKTHVVAHTSGAGYEPSNDGDDYQFYGTVKWEPGDYDEMLLLTVRVSSDYYNQDGSIVITSHATCGMDTRNENLTLWPINVNYANPEWWYGDVNHDCLIDICDITTFMNYFVYFDSSDFYTDAGDINQDGTIDLRDMEMTYDHLFYYDNWMDGYVLSQGESSCYVKIEQPDVPEPDFGDLDGDGILTITDITIMIDMLLNNSVYMNEIDVNGDGTIDIDDAIMLINRLLDNI